jgi:hypothetical protein
MTTRKTHMMTVLDALNAIDECRTTAEQLLATAESLERLLEFSTRPTPDFETLARAAGWEDVPPGWRQEAYVRRKSDYYRLCEVENRIPARFRDEHEIASDWEAACRRDKLCEFFEPTVVKRPV